MINSIKFKYTPEQIELVKATASKDRNVAYEAQAALAKLISPVLAEVINQAPVLSNLFTDIRFNADDNVSLPLDLYYDVTDEDYVEVWSQEQAGGLPTSHVLPTMSEMKIPTYSLDTAVSWDRKYSAKHRLDVVAKTFSRVAQEILLKQNRHSANVIMTSLANASTNGVDHVQFSTANDQFVLQDLNELLTLAKRILTSWYGGTPSGGRGKGITDLIVSPEIVELIRAMAYNPINTSTGPLGGTSAEGIVAPDDLRMDIFRNAGIPEFYGISIMEFNEFGVDQVFNTVFDDAAGSTTYTLAGGGAATGGGHANGTFEGNVEEILVGIDRTRDSLLRAVAVDEDDGVFSLSVDDQWSVRQGKIGYWGGLEEGRLCVDQRALVGKIV
jgi:hypothetical protein